MESWSTAVIDPALSKLARTYHNSTQLATPPLESLCALLHDGISTITLQPALGEESFLCPRFGVSIVRSNHTRRRIQGRDVGLGASNMYNPWRFINAPVRDIPLQVARTTVIGGIVTALCRLARFVSPNPTGSSSSGHPYGPLDTDSYGPQLRAHVRCKRASTSPIPQTTEYHS